MRISDWSSDVCSSDLGSSTGSSQVKTREIPPIQAPKTPAKAKARKPNRQDQSNTRTTKRPQCQNTRTSPTKARTAARVTLPNKQSQRSEERRVGKGRVSTCTARCQPHKKKKKKKK